MPKYENVSTDQQLSTTRNRRSRTTPPTGGASAPAPEAWVTMTTTMPADVRRELAVALAVHNIKLKDAITDAVRAWLAEHPVTG